PSLHAIPPIRRSLSARPRSVDEKRESAENKRRNDAREFAVDGVRTQRAGHERDQRRRGGAPPRRNQHADAAEDFQRSDDVLSVGRVAPPLEPLGPSRRRGPGELRNAHEGERRSEEDSTHPYR